MTCIVMLVVFGHVQSCAMSSESRISTFASWCCKNCLVVSRVCNSDVVSRWWADTVLIIFFCRVVVCSVNRSTTKCHVTTLCKQTLLHLPHCKVLMINIYQLIRNWWCPWIWLTEFTVSIKALCMCNVIPVMVVLCNTMHSIVLTFVVWMCPSIHHTFFVNCTERLNMSWNFFFDPVATFF